MLDVQLECQDLERISIVNRLGRFHGRNHAAAVEGSSASEMTPRRIFPERHVMSFAVPGNLPEGVYCLSLQWNDLPLFSSRSDDLGCPVNPSAPYPMQSMAEQKNTTKRPRDVFQPINSCWLLLLSHISSIGPCILWKVKEKTVDLPSFFSDDE